jgi:hypothetical protein
MICDFSNPVNYTGSPPAAGDPFAFSQTTCGLSDTTEQITGSGTFWINKEIDYGQILVLSFLLILIVAASIKFLWNFVKQDSSQKL